ncbi:MAG: hypothetical protein D6729_06555 [Deltaproteobacteria bacterium]|nr:MAG: hypothetical protein D6729_06555 [Deltaproteobacteria bacterium]
MNRIGLGPGARVVMALAGLALIGYGLYLADLLDPLLARIAGEPAAGPSPRPAPPSARSTPPATVPPAPLPVVPPLAVPAPAPLKVDEVSLRGEASPDEVLARLRRGEVDVAAVPLHELVWDGGAGLVVVGAAPPGPALVLCSDEGDPMALLRAGRPVSVARASQALLAAHIAEVQGRQMGPGDFEAGDGALRLLDAASAEGSCLSLVSLGVQGPRPVVARREDALRYGRSYQALVAERGLAAATWLASTGPRGYTNRARYLSSLAARLGGKAVAPPPVARWVQEGP